MKNLLKTYFGYDEFRPLQEEIAENVIKRSCGAKTKQDKII